MRDLSIVTQDAIKNLKRQIASPTPMFKLLKNTDRLRIMNKSTSIPFLKYGIQRRLSSMTKRGMTNVMSDCNCFDKILVQFKTTANRASDPRHHLHMQGTPS